MSDTDSFIDEVTEEVRRDKLFAQMRRYGWIAVLAVLILVGGAAYNEFRKAKAKSAAQDLGDAVLSALDQNEAENRAAKLEQVQGGTADSQAIISMLTAIELASVGQQEQAATSLASVADNADLPLIYRQIARYKMLTLQTEGLDIDARRAGFEGLVAPGSSVRLLAEEQLALIDIESGETEAALDRLQQIVADAEVTAGLRQRASQLIVALGGTLEPVLQQ